MKKSAWFLLLAVVLTAGCSDVVTSRYKTYNDAASDGLFGRGWLPEIIPQSSYDIVTSNDLDLNISHGEFSFNLEEKDLFQSMLKPYRGRKTPFLNYKKVVKDRESQGYIAFEYSANKCVWIFYINEKTGHVYYDLWLEHNSASKK